MRRISPLNLNSGSHPTGHRLCLRGATLIVAFALALPLQPPAKADVPVTVVDCDATLQDISTVQDAIDVAPDGGTVRLRGACDFTTAAAHRAGPDWIEAAAVVVRPGNPVHGLTIEADGEPLSVTISGSGLQTAFFVAPGSSDVTIRGLRLVGFGRPIVVANARNVTIGVDGQATPTAGGNQITGDARMNSGVLAVAREATLLTVNYGALGAESASFDTTGLPLADLQVDGNLIVYRPMGAPTADAAITGVDVRQRGNGVAQGVRVRHNAIGFIANDFPSFDQNAIRVLAQDGGPAARIVDVTVADNNVGWLEILTENAQQGAAGGRVGAFVRGAHGVEVARNVVRSQVTPTALPIPGAGILLADVTGDATLPATVHHNTVQVIADPSAPAADLGAIGLVDNALTLFGNTEPSLPTRGIVVADNVVVLSQRGLVLNGAQHVTLTRNTVATSQGPALSIGVTAQGSGSGAGAAPVNLRGAVREAVACVNTFDQGQVDAERDVEMESGNVANAFPGGQVAQGNFRCQPTVATDRTSVGIDQSLAVSGRAWAARPVTVTLSAPAQDRPLSSDGLARYATTYTTAQLAGFGSTVNVRATALDDLPSGLQMSSGLVRVNKDLQAPGAPEILRPSEGQRVYDTGVLIEGSAERFAMVTVSENGTPIGQTVAGDDERWTLPATLAPGTHTVAAEAQDAARNSSGTSAPRSFVVDTSSPPAPTIQIEDGGDGAITVDESAAAFLSGTRPTSSQIRVTIADESSVTTDVVATVPTGDGPWQAGPLNLSTLSLGRLRATAVAVRPQAVSPPASDETRLVPNEGGQAAPLVDIVDADGIVSPARDDLGSVEVKVTHVGDTPRVVSLRVTGEGHETRFDLDGDVVAPGIQPLQPDQTVGVLADLSSFVDGEVRARATVGTSGSVGEDSTLLDRQGPVSGFTQGTLPVCVVVPVVGFGTCELSGETRDDVSGVRLVYVTGTRDGGGTFAMTARLERSDATHTTWRLTSQDLAGLNPGIWTFRADGTDRGANPESGTAQVFTLYVL